MPPKENHKRATGNAARRSTVLEKLIRQYEQSLMDLMAIQEELRSLPMNDNLQELLRHNVEIATLTKTGLEIARLRVERQQQFDTAEFRRPWLNGWS